MSQPTRFIPLASRTGIAALVDESCVSRVSSGRCPTWVAVTCSIDRLLTAGLVTRDDNPANRREVILGLTPAGRRVVRRVTARRRAEITGIVTAIPPEHRRHLIAALRAFAAAAGEPDPQPEHTTGLGW